MREDTAIILSEESMQAANLVSNWRELLTRIDEIKKGAKYYMEGIPTYRSLEEVPKTLVKDTVADIALTPQVVPQMFESLANSGIKKIILPKPVPLSKRGTCCNFAIRQGRSIYWYPKHQI